MESSGGVKVKNLVTLLILVLIVKKKKEKRKKNASNGCNVILL